MPEREQKRSVTYLLKAVWLLLVLIALATGVEFFSGYLIRHDVSEELQRQLKVVRGETSDEPIFIPNALWHHDLNPKYREYYTLTRWGTRGDDFSLPKPTGELRVLALGDSTTEGWKNPDDETYPHFLQSYLAASAVIGRRFDAVKVINAGVGSHNTAFNLAYLLLRGLNFQPDILVLKSSYNDFYPYVSKDLGIDYTNVFRTPLIAERTNPGFWNVARHSSFISLLGLRLLDAPYRQYLGMTFNFVTTDHEFDENLKKRSLTENNILAMVRAAKARGVKVVLLDFPRSPEDAHYQVSLRDEALIRRFVRFDDSLNALVEDVARRERVPLVTTRNELSGADFWDHAHNTKSGNQRIGEAVGLEIEADLERGD